MKEEISEEQRADYLDAFNMFDNNQDGTITREEAENHPKKNMLMKALGCTAYVEPDVTVKGFLKNDILLMASDGLTNMVKENEIFDTIKKYNETDEDIARYSVLHDNDRLFMSKYLTYLPSKEQLKEEIDRQKEIFYMQHPALKDTSHRRNASESD